MKNGCKIFLLTHTEEALKAFIYTLRKINEEEYEKSVVVESSLLKFRFREMLKERQGEEGLSPFGV